MASISIEIEALGAPGNYTWTARFCGRGPGKDFREADPFVLLDKIGAHIAALAPPGAPPVILPPRPLPPAPPSRPERGKRHTIR